MEPEALSQFMRDPDLAPIRSARTKRAITMLKRLPVDVSTEKFRAACVAFVNALRAEALDHGSDRDVWFNYHRALGYMDAGLWEMARVATEEAQDLAYQLYQDSWEDKARQMLAFIRQQIALPR